MSPGEREAGLVVIEGPKFFEGAQRVAVVTSPRRRELVRIAMARVARAILEVEPLRGAGVALKAGHGGVSAGQSEAGLLVAGERERRRPECVDRMTGFTATLMRRRGKLALVRIRVTGEAGIVRELVASGCAGRAMALRTVEGEVTAGERIGRPLMLES
jgi:hypothetical protein